MTGGPTNIAQNDKRVSVRDCQLRHGRKRNNPALLLLMRNILTSWQSPENARTAARILFPSNPVVEIWVDCLKDPKSHDSGYLVSPILSRAQRAWSETAESSC